METLSKANRWAFSESVSEWLAAICDAILFQVERSVAGQKERQFGLVRASSGTAEDTHHLDFVVIGSILRAGKGIGWVNPEL